MNLGSFDGCGFGLGRVICFVVVSYLVFWVVRVRASVYVDRDLWERFRRYALRRGVSVSGFLEEVIAEGLVEDFLGEVLSELAGAGGFEGGFEPVEVEGGGSVSELVRLERDGRARGLSG